MSFSDAIGQVDQIVQWEQQLANPAGLTQSSGTAAGGNAANTASSAAPGTASFSAALAQAQAQNGPSALSMLDPAAAAASPVTSAAAATSPAAYASASIGATAAPAAAGPLAGGDSALLSALQAAGGSPGSASSGGLLSAIASTLQSGGASGATAGATVASSPASGTFGSPAASAGDPRIQSMIQEANSLIGKPYVWGGGHNDFGPQAGYDCSGFVSAVLHAGGYLTSPQDTETLPAAAGIESGPGQYVTIYDRTSPGQEGHVIMEINGQFYESGGEQGTWGGGGGVQAIATPSPAYLSSFNLILHPAGL